MPVCIWGEPYRLFRSDDALPIHRQFPNLNVKRSRSARRAVNRHRQRLPVRSRVKINLDEVHPKAARNPCRAGLLRRIVDQWRAGVSDAARGGAVVQVIRIVETAQARLPRRSAPPALDV